MNAFLSTLSLFFTSFFLLIFSPILTKNNPYPEKPILVIITSYNNKNWYARNLQSVLSQNYANFRVFYTDDFSPDGTGDLVEEYLIDNDLDKKVYLTKNTIRRGSLHNTYTMIQLCDDDTIIVNLDGDDWFPDNDILTRINNIYSSNEIWLTYGQFQTHPTGEKGWASPMPQQIVESNSFRLYTGLPTHLRTFYAWLFKEIKLEDLLYLGKFHTTVPDMAIMFPMIEMAGERHQFISDIMYIYNEENPLSEHHINRQLQINTLENLKLKKPYNRLIKKPIKRKSSNTIQSDAIVFAQNPTKLLRLLKSLKLQVKDIAHIFTMYQPTTALEVENYNAIQELYPEIKFYLVNDTISHFRDTLVEIYKRTENNYIFFIKDGTIFTKPLSLYECINAIEDTSAYAFYFNLNAHDGINTYPHLPLLECKPNICAWDFTVAEKKWSCANSLDCVLYKKTDYFTQLLLRFYDLRLESLEYIWTNELYANCIGLCFTESHTREI
jgi:glycosyltransferase involved in cell wall biosynthesis